jgi:hypothetical protein
MVECRAPQNEAADNQQALTTLEESSTKELLGETSNLNLWMILGSTNVQKGAPQGHTFNSLSSERGFSHRDLEQSATVPKSINNRIKAERPKGSSKKDIGIVSSKN